MEEAKPQDVFFAQRASRLYARACARGEPTIGMYGERKTNARCPCTPQSTVETFGEEISAEACSIYSPGFWFSAIPTTTLTASAPSSTPQTLPCDSTLGPSVNILNDTVWTNCSEKTPTTTPNITSGYAIVGAIVGILSVALIIIIFIIIVVAFRKKLLCTLFSQTNEVIIIKLYIRFFE